MLPHAPLNLTLDEWSATYICCLRWFLYQLNRLCEGWRRLGHDNILQNPRSCCCILIYLVVISNGTDCFFKGGQLFSWLEHFLVFYVTQINFTKWHLFPRSLISELFTHLSKKHVYSKVVKEKVILFSLFQCDITSQPYDYCRLKTTMSPYILLYILYN